MSHGTLRTLLLALAVLAALAVGLFFAARCPANAPDGWRVGYILVAGCDARTRK